MENFKNLFPKDLYHSYIVEGDPVSTSFSLSKFFEERGDIQVNSPDILIENYDSFTIENSRRIKDWHSELGITKGKKFCIIGAKFINHDAERTLLKIIEEPATNTHFFLVVPNALTLLDTIRSRVHIVNTRNSNNNYEDKAKEFLSLTPKMRIDFVASMIKEYKNDEGSGSLRYGATSLINEIEKIIFNKFKKEHTNIKIAQLLEDLQKNREYLNLPGSSPKMILEYLSLVL